MLLHMFWSTFDPASSKPFWTPLVSATVVSHADLTVPPSGLSTGGAIGSCAQTTSSPYVGTS